MVLPLLLALLLGLIDFGRYMWTTNRGEKAAQMGARYAVATDIIPAGLSGYSFATSGNIPQGDPIPQSAFGGASCTSTSQATVSPYQSTAVTCSCNGTCPSLGTASLTAFNNILTRMQKFMPEVKADQVQVDYSYSGLGYAGDPNGIDVAPLVVVSLKNMTFRPGFLLGYAISLPTFTSELTLEDGTGNFAQ